MQMIVRVPKKNAPNALRASGQDGVFVRPFFEGEEDSETYKIVPFADDLDLAGAIRQVARVGDHCGVVKTRRGYGARVAAENFEEAVRMIRTDDAAAFLGTRYEVSGLPLSCGREAIQDLLMATWTEAVPIATYRTNRSRTWVVSASTAPMDNKLQHDDGLAYIQVVPPKSRQQKKDQHITFVPCEKPKEEPSWLRSWSGKPRSMPAEEASPPMPPPQRRPLARAQPLVMPSQNAMEVEPTPQSSVQAQDWCAMIRETVAAAVAPLSASIASLDSRLSGLDDRLVALASEVTELQTAAARRECSPPLRAGERGDGRETSRSRGRVPLGKKLGRG